MTVHSARTLAFLAALALLAASASRAQVNFTGSYTQTFTEATNGVTGSINTAAAYTWTDNSTIAGWYAAVNGSTPSQYRATNSNGNSGDVGIYLFRASGTSGALGTMRSSSNTGATYFGVQLANSTGSAIESFAVSYLGQQWQDNTGGSDTLTFQYSLDATSLTTGTWTTVSALSFSSVQDTNTGTNYVSLAPTGSSVAPSTSVSGSITGLGLASGATIWFRWVDENNTGVDDALSIDNLSITSSAVPEPSAYAVIAGVIGFTLAAFRRAGRGDPR